MNHSTSKTSSDAVIKLSGRFDFQSLRPFRDMYEPILQQPAVAKITLDLSTVEYLDSAALGMLLMLRDKAEKVHKKVALSGCRGVVRTVLDVANFGRLFEMA